MMRPDEIAESSDTNRMTGGHVVVVADGDVDAVRLASLTYEEPLVVAADGGASKVLAAGIRPDIVVGDGDSLRAEERARLEALGVDIRDAHPDKNESDTELCLMAAVEMGATRISILGALGGERPEHTVANLLLLADPRLDGIEVEILSGNSRLTRIGGRDRAGLVQIEGRPGDYVSLFPLDGSVIGVRTEGLRFELRGETLTVGPTRGLSNEMLEVRARVASERGQLMVVHTGRSIKTTVQE
jgi:thiamine pyrophosphokinase